MENLDPSRLKDIKNCPLCFGESRVVCKTKTINEESTLEVSLRECLLCGHWWNNPIPEQDLLTSLYNKGSEYVVPKDYGDSLLVSEDCGHIDIYTKICKKIAPYSKKFQSNTFNYLEIGIGSGKIFNIFKKTAQTAYGIEPGKWATNELVGEVRSNVLQSIEDIPLDVRFDVVVAHDVLEHLSNPISMLHTIHRLANRECVINATFPNKDSLKAKIQRCRWHMVRPLGHLHYFSKRSVKKMFELSGWIVVECKPTRIGEATALDIIKNFNYADKNIIYKLVKSLLVGQLFLGKDQWVVTAIRK